MKECIANITKSIHSKHSIINYLQEKFIGTVVSRLMEKEKQLHIAVVALQNLHIKYAAEIKGKCNRRN